MLRYGSNMAKNKHLSAYVSVALSIALLGSTGVTVRIASDTMDPLAFGALRTVGIAVVLLLLFKNLRPALKPAMLFKILPGGVLIAANMGLFVVGVSMSGALAAAILSLTIPIFVYAFSVMLLHEPIIKRALVGGIVALLGSMLLVGLPAILHQDIEIGDLLLLGSYASLAGAIIHAKYMYKWLTPNQLISVRFMISGLILTACTFVFSGANAFIEGSALAWGMVVLNILIIGSIGYTVYYNGLRHMKAEQTAPLMYLEPLSGTILAAIILSEGITSDMLVGVAVIIAGVLISNPHHTRLYFHYHLPKARGKLSFLKRT